MQVALTIIAWAGIVLAVNLIIVAVLDERERGVNAIASAGATLIGMISLMVRDWSGQ